MKKYQEELRNWTKYLFTSQYKQLDEGLAMKVILREYLEEQVS